MIEAKLRQYLVAQKWANHNALDNDLLHIAADKLRAGELSADTYFELVESERKDAEATGDADALRMIDEHFSIAAIDERAAALDTKLDALQTFGETKEFARMINRLAKRQRTPDDDDADDDETETDEEDSIMSKHYDGDDPTALFATSPARDRKRDDEYVRQPDVKDATGRYSATRYVAKHSKTGQVLRDRRGEELMLPSESQLATMGALWKQMAIKAGIHNGTLTEHERSLIAESFKGNWIGQVDGKEQFISGARAKTIFNDSTSGAVYLSPEWFDAAVVTPSLLLGELAPYVDRVNMPRADAIETARIDPPTVTWAANEQTAMTPFTTDGLVSEITASVHEVTVAVEMGRNMLSDVAVDLGRILAGLIAERMGEELDRVIAVGNGTTEPQGLFSASGATAVPSTNGSSGSFVTADIENMLKALGKQYRKPGSNSIRFVSNDTTYWRTRGIPVGASDARRVFGQSYEDYMLAGRPYSVQNDISNTQFAFLDLKRYRLWNRGSYEQRWVDGGQTLALKNTALLIVRGRFAGKMLLGDAMAKMTTAPH